MKIIITKNGKEVGALDYKELKESSLIDNTLYIDTGKESRTVYDNLNDGDIANFFTQIKAENDKSDPIKVIKELYGPLVKAMTERPKYPFSWKDEIQHPTLKNKKKKNESN